MTNVKARGDPCGQSVDTKMHACIVTIRGSNEWIPFNLPVADWASSKIEAFRTTYVHVLTPCRTMDDWFCKFCILRSFVILFSLLLQSESILEHIIITAQRENPTAHFGFQNMPLYPWILCSYHRISKSTNGMRFLEEKLLEGVKTHDYSTNRRLPVIVAAVDDIAQKRRLHKSLYVAVKIIYGLVDNTFGSS